MQAWDLYTASTTMCINWRWDKLYIIVFLHMSLLQLISVIDYNAIVEIDIDNSQWIGNITVFVMGILLVECPYINSNGTLYQRIPFSCN